jgi:D-alanine-D-alanine ligase-like ATP-grasp enzyme
LLDDLPQILLLEQPQLVKNDINIANNIKNKILNDIHSIINELFSAFENEYSIFCPMTHCFEIFGLDFMVDNNFQVFLLEVNPGPDFKQTGFFLKKN